MNDSANLARETMAKLTPNQIKPEIIGPYVSLLVLDNVLKTEEVSGKSASPTMDILKKNGLAKTANALEKADFIQNEVKKLTTPEKINEFLSNRTDRNIAKNISAKANERQKVSEKGNPSVEHQVTKNTGKTF